MKINITLDITETFARMIDRLCDPSVTQPYLEIKRSLINIMGSLDNLRTAVNSVQTTVEAGNAAFELAFAELAADIAAIPSNADVQAEADRVAGVATALGQANTAFAQRLRDALPTAAPTEPLPPVETPVDPEA